MTKVQPFVSSASFVQVFRVLQNLYGSKAASKVFQTVELPRPFQSRSDLFAPNQKLLHVLHEASSQEMDRLLGLRIGQMFPFSALGDYGRYVVDAPSLDAAISRAMKALHYHEQGATLTLDTEIESGLAELKYQCSSPITQGAHLQNEAVMFILVNLIREFAGPNWQPAGAIVSSSRDTDVIRIENFLGYGVDSAPGITGIRFPMELLNRVNLNREDSGMTISDLRRLACHIPPESVSDGVRQVLRSSVHEGDMSMESVAHHLNLGVRTLQRRLTLEGISYREITSSIIRDRANDLLSDSDWSVTHIATSLGYSCKEHFIRAYKRSTGITPGVYRKAFTSKSGTSR